MGSVPRFDERRAIKAQPLRNWGPVPRWHQRSPNQHLARRQRSVLESAPQRNDAMNVTVRSSNLKNLVIGDLGAKQSARGYRILRYYGDLRHTQLNFHKEFSALGSGRRRPAAKMIAEPCFPAIVRDLARLLPTGSTGCRTCRRAFRQSPRSAACYHIEPCRSRSALAASAAMQTKSRNE